MQKLKVPKQVINKIGRIFALLFNRAVMYDVNHPFTKQSSAEFLTVIRQGLALYSPLVLIMNQDHFFIEEEALDPRINASKMLSHFKKAEIQSVSFHKGLNAEELHRFVIIFINLARYPNADGMKSALEQQSVENIRINHVFLKKVTADDEVIDRRSLKSVSMTAADASRKLLARSVLAEELELSGELQNDDLSHLLEESTEEIGVSGKDLPREVNLNPKGAAELIYLASEIHKGTGDEKVLSDLLVDYIERIGLKMVLESTESAGEEDGDHLRQVISGVESELVRRLQNKDIDAGVLDRVTQRLNNRLEACMQKLQSQWTLQSTSISETGSEDPTSVFNILEESVEVGDELNTILKQVRSKYDGQGLNENDYNIIYKEISKAKQKQVRRQRKGDMPKGILNRRSTLYILEKEIARSIRYGSPFSVLMISMVKVLPETKIPPGSLSRGEITNAILEELMTQVRNTDIIGVLDKRKIMALMPMTIESESKTAMRRILKAIHNTDLAAGKIKVKVKLAGAVTTFDHQRTSTLQKFVQLAETEIFDMVNRLRNIQSLY